MFCQSWYENKKYNQSEEHPLVIEVAAAIIRDGIRFVLVNIDTYSPVNKMFDDINENILYSILLFLKQIIIKNNILNILYIVYYII